MKQPRPSVYLSRRGFIQFCFAWLAAARAGFLVQNWLFPLRLGGEVKPVEVPLEKVPEGGVKLIVYGDKPAIVMRPAEDIYALSRVCTHLACTVQWQPDRKEFYCACHDGWYDQFGNVLSGPPPAPLERLPVKVDGNKIVVGES